MYSHPCPAHWPDEGSSRFDRHPVRNQGGTKLLRGMISPVHCLSKEQQKGGRPPEPPNLSLLSHPSTKLFQLKGRQEGSLPDTALRHWVVLHCLFVKTWWRGGCLQVAGPLSPAPSGWRPQETDNRASRTGSAACLALLQALGSWVEGVPLGPHPASQAVTGGTTHRNHLLPRASAHSEHTTKTCRRPRSRLCQLRGGWETPEDRRWPGETPQQDIFMASGKWKTTPKKGCLSSIMSNCVVTKMGA